MNLKLIQKHLLKGSQEFEVFDDYIIAKINKPFADEQIKTIMLAMINPEPIKNKSRLEFHSRVKRNPLLSLFINKPNTEEFNAFAEAVKEKALNEYNSFAGLK